MKIVRGDIKYYPFSSGVLLQQVNCQGVYGAGVSGVISNRWPKVKYDYTHYSSGLEPDALLGSLQLIKISDDFFVANSFSQLNYGNSDKSGRVYTDMRHLVSNVQWCLDNVEGIVYVPYKVGCGLAGGSWDEFCSYFVGSDLVIIKM